MAFEFRVTKAFAEYARGDVISAAEDMAKIVGTEWENHVVRVAVPDVPVEAAETLLPTGG